MKVLGIDLPKMKRLSSNGYDIDTLCPGLLDDKNENNSNQKVSQPIDWFMPDLSANKKKIASKNAISKPGVYDHYSRRHGGL